MIIFWENNFVPFCCNNSEWFRQINCNRFFLACTADIKVSMAVPIYKLLKGKFQYKTGKHNLFVSFHYFFTPLLYWQILLQDVLQIVSVICFFSIDRLCFILLTWKTLIITYVIHAKIYHGWSAKINVMVKPDWLWLHQCNNDFTLC